MHLNRLGRFSLLAFLTASLMAAGDVRGESFSSLTSLIPQRSDMSGSAWTVCTDADWAPFEWIAIDGTSIGFDLDVLRIIAWFEGTSIAVQNISFDNIIPSLQVGQCDIGAAAMTITPERDQVVDFSQPYWWMEHETYGFTVREGDPKELLSSINQGIDSLRSAHVWPFLVAAYFGSDPSTIERARNQCQGLMDQGDMSGFVNCLFSAIYPS